MLAWILKGPAAPLVLEERPDPEPGPGEAVVSLRAAALNHRDVWLQQGNYFMSKYPVVLGADGAGEVVKVGSKVDRSWLGRAVIVNPGVGWGDNEKFALDDFKTLGTPEDGTFAEKLLIPASQLYDQPKHLDVVHAAALPLAGLTGFRALFGRGGLVEGEHVLVTGAGGGVAQFMLQFAVAAKARVYVTTSSREKLDRARSLGALGGVNYKDADWAEQLAKVVPGGFNLIVDSACGPGFGKFVSLASPGGRIVYFGLTAGPAPALDMRNFYRKQLSLLGTKMGSLRDFAAMCAFVEKHRLVPVVDSVTPFKSLDKAFEKLHHGGQFGKMAFTFDG